MSLGTPFFEKIEKNKVDQLNAGQSLSSKDQQLLQKVWSASACTARVNNNINDGAIGLSSCVSSGYQRLDNLLSLQGWPLGVTTEIGLSQAGIGELRLLLPALRVLQQRDLSKRHILWIAPPFTPLATSLLKEGLDIDYLTIVQPENVKEVIWAYEQALLSASCVAVVAWTGRYRLSNKALRRLQLAAEKSQSLSVLFRDERCLKQASASHFRLSLQSNCKSQLELHIRKQPQSWGDQRCTLSLHPHYEDWQRLPVALLPHFNTPLLNSPPLSNEPRRSNSPQLSSEPQRFNRKSSYKQKKQIETHQQATASVSSIVSTTNVVTHKSDFD